MRMWMVSPRVMCRKHLLGEHLELHMLNGSLRSGKSIAGFLDKKLLEPSALAYRHRELVKEMRNRGYKHESPLIAIKGLKKFSAFKVDKVASLKELALRCKACAIMICENKVAKMASARVKAMRYQKARPVLVNARNVTWLKTQREKAAGRKTPKCCDVCHKIGKIHFDHDHKSGAFRGWLCQSCNWVIGHATDNPKLLRKLADYLEKFAKISLADKRRIAKRVSTVAWQARLSRVSH